MPKTYIEGFHQLPEQTRIEYHNNAIAKGLSLDDALLLDCQKFAKSSPNQATDEKILTNLHILSPKKT